jgi:hypothetical protein
MRVGLGVRWRALAMRVGLGVRWRALASARPVFDGDLR